MALFLVLVSVLLGGLRAVGVTHVAYQAVAHCWVGWLFGAGYVGKRKACVWLAWLLCLLEIWFGVVVRFLGPDPRLWFS